MSTPNGLKDFCIMFEDAVKECNKRSGYTVLNPDSIINVVYNDLLYLASYAASYDGKITPEEIGALNEMLSEIGPCIKTSESECEEVAKLVNENAFGIPVTLTILTHKALATIEDWNDMGYKMKNLIIQSEMITLVNAILTYTIVMCAIATQNTFTAIEKSRVLASIEKCIDYVAERLGQDFRRMSASYKNIIDGEYARHVEKANATSEDSKVNFKPVYANANGKIADVCVKEGDSIKKDDVVAVVVNGTNSYKILAGMTGKINKVRITIGEDIKSTDLVAIIAKN